MFEDGFLENHENPMPFFEAGEAFASVGFVDGGAPHPFPPDDNLVGDLGFSELSLFWSLAASPPMLKTFTSELDVLCAVSKGDLAGG